MIPISRRKTDMNFFGMLINLTLMSKSMPNSARTFQNAPKSTSGKKSIILGHPWPVTSYHLRPPWIRSRSFSMNAQGVVEVAEYWGRWNIWWWILHLNEFSMWSVMCNLIMCMRVKTPVFRISHEKTSWLGKSCLRHVRQPFDSKNIYVFF